MVKVVLVGRRHSNVFGVNDLYFVNQNHKRVKPENILLEITFAKLVFSLCNSCETDNKSFFKVIQPQLRDATPAKTSGSKTITC